MSDTIREGLQAALGNGYTIGRELGGGGMSRVYVARDEALGRDVVVKVLSPAIAQEFSVERFTREIRLAANLQHAHIVPLLSAGATADGLPYYLMPFVEGESLRHHLAGGKGLPIDEVVLVLKDVARALSYAHARGVVHRDIKPDNVMLSGGAAVVTDFGIAKAVTSAREPAPTPGAPEDSLTRMGTSLGTPAYMAPEQGAGDPDTDHRADIYAFGAMAYELLSGETPFGTRPPHALLVAHFTEAPVPVAEKRPDVPAPLADLVMRCLAKDPAQRPQTAADVLATLDIASAARVSGAFTQPTGPARVPAGAAAGAIATARRPAWRTLAIAAAALAAVGVAGFAGYRYFRRAPGIDASLIAVMPFNVRDTALGMWREGMVDVLSRSLDGAGALRTVAASTTIGKSPTRADPASAEVLGKDVGAGLVMFGDVSAIGRDSVHLRAAVFDVTTGSTRFDIDVRGEGSRMDALADSLSLRVLRELGSAGGIGGSRLNSVGTSSLPALKAFLQGQQHYRRGQVDSARVAYEAAVEYDSTFALAWRGVASLYIRQGRENDPAAQQALDRAIRHKSGRSPRDSLLLRGDSLRLAVTRRTPGRTDALDPIAQLPLLYETLREAVTRYPSDAELWLEYGDAMYHFGEFAGVTHSDALAAFERGIGLDSTFIVPYAHAADIAMRSGETAKAAKYMRRMAALYPGEGGVYYRMTAAVLDSPPPFSREAQTLLDSLPGRFTAGLMGQFASMPDSGARALGLVARQKTNPARVEQPADSTALHEAVAMVFASRGRYREAVASHAGPLSPSLYFQAAEYGAIPADSALERARRWARTDPQRGLSGARFLSERRDTSTIALLERWADSIGTAMPGTPTAQRATGYVAILRAQQMIARGDSARALTTLLALPMATCGGIPCAGRTVATLLEGAGRQREAARVLDRWLPAAMRSGPVPAELMQRARLAVALGEEERATAIFRQVVALWSGADAALQPLVKEARDGLARGR